MEEAVAMKFIAVAITMAGGAFGGGYGLSVVFSSWMNSIARNPSADAKLRMVGMIGFAGTELVLLMSFVIATLLIFVA